MEGPSLDVRLAFPRHFHGGPCPERQPCLWRQAGGEPPWGSQKIWTCCRTGGNPSSVRRMAREVSGASSSCPISCFPPAAALLPVLCVGGLCPPAQASSPLVLFSAPRTASSFSSSGSLLPLGFLSPDLPRLFSWK